MYIAHCSNFPAKSRRVRKMLASYKAIPVTLLMKKYAVTPAGGRRRWKQSLIDLQIEKAYRVPLKFKEKKATPRHMLVRFLNWKDKEKILEVSRQRKQVSYNGTKVRLTSDFSLATLNARRQWNNICRVLREIILSQELYILPS